MEAGRSAAGLLSSEINVSIEFPVELAKGMIKSEELVSCIDF